MDYSIRSRLNLHRWMDESAARLDAKIPRLARQMNFIIQFDHGFASHATNAVTSTEVEGDTTYEVFLHIFHQLSSAYGDRNLATLWNLYNSSVARFLSLWLGTRIFTLLPRDSGNGEMDRVRNEREKRAFEDFEK